MPIRESKIEIVPYDPTWPTAFEAEAVRLRSALKALALRIDHHGSTAVPGLGAKPIIDIQVSVATLQPLSAYGAHLEAIGKRTVAATIVASDPESHERYARAKTDFVERVVALAVEHGYPRDLSD